MSEISSEFLSHPYFCYSCLFLPPCHRWQSIAATANNSLELFINSFLGIIPSKREGPLLRDGLPFVINFSDTVTNYSLLYMYHCTYIRVCTVYKKLCLNGFSANLCNVVLIDLSLVFQAMITTRLFTGTHFWEATVFHVNPYMYKQHFIWFISLMANQRKKFFPLIHNQQLHE